MDTLYWYDQMLCHCGLSIVWTQSYLTHTLYIVMPHCWQTCVAYVRSAGSCTTPIVLCGLALMVVCGVCVGVGVGVSQGVGSAWGGNPELLSPAPRFMDMEEFVCEAAACGAIVILAAHDTLTATGELQVGLAGEQDAASHLLFVTGPWSASARWSEGLGQGATVRHVCSRCMCVCALNNQLWLSD